MVRSLLVLSLSLILPSTAFAQSTTAFLCDGSGNYVSTNGAPGKSQFDRDHTLLYVSPCLPTNANPASNAVCIDEAKVATILAISAKYRKCADTDADTFEDDIVEMTQAEKDAVDAAQVTAVDTALRTDTKAQVDGQNVDALSLRCIAKILLDEVNILRTRTNDTNACIVNANNLGSAQSCISGLSTFSDRTLAQAKTAYYGCVDNNEADE